MELSATRAVYSKARAAADKALELDDRLGEAHTVVADVTYWMNWDWEVAEREFKRAIELSPGYATAHQRYSMFLATMGRTGESLAEIHRAQSLDPLSPSISSSVGWRLLWARRYDDAVEQLQKTFEMDPSFGRTHLVLGWVYEAQGRREKAVDELQKAALSNPSPGTLASLGHAYAVGGYTREAQKILKDLKDRSKRAYVPDYDIAIVYAGLGKPDRAFEWLARSCVHRDVELTFVKVDPEMDSLRGSPHFNEVLNCVGLAQ
jgi:tetratricopeptide (TPR) repeat protein